MADITIFDQNFTLDVAADVSIDFSASHSYSSFSGNEPWTVRIVVDGSDNVARGGAGAISDVVQVMGACGQLAPGTHNVKIIWYGTPAITIRGSVLRVLVAKR